LDLSCSRIFSSSIPALGAPSSSMLTCFDDVVALFRPADQPTSDGGTSIAASAKALRTPLPWAETPSRLRTPGGRLPASPDDEPRDAAPGTRDLARDLRLAGRHRPEHARAYFGLRQRPRVTIEKNASTRSMRVLPTPAWLPCGARASRPSRRGPREDVFLAAKALVERARARPRPWPRRPAGGRCRTRPLRQGDGHVQESCPFEPSSRHE